MNVLMVIINAFHRSLMSAKIRNMVLNAFVKTIISCLLINRTVFLYVNLVSSFSCFCILLFSGSRALIIVIAAFVIGRFGLDTLTGQIEFRVASGSPMLQLFFAVFSPGSKLRR